MTPLERTARWVTQSNPHLRGLGNDPRKFERNLDIIARVSAGERKTDIAARHGLHRQRITEIASKYERVQRTIDAALNERAQ